jgi:hypothetical protein
MLKSLWRIYHEFTTTVNWQAELKVEPSIGDEAAVVRASEMSPKKIQRFYLEWGRERDMQKPGFIILLIN